MELLNIQNVSKVIKHRTIVNDISIKVNEGEIVGFLGPNGAGKTTTIKMIMGLFSITSGNISVCGHDVSTDFEKAMSNVGGIIENPDLYKRATGRRNLEYFATMHGEAALANVDSVVALVKMTERIDEKVKTYSLGMRQRVGVAQALLHTPSLLVLDEPTNGLDPIGIKELRDLFKDLSKRSGVGILISSHLLSEMEQMCDRYYIIENGEIIDEKTMIEVAGVLADFAFVTGDPAALGERLAELGYEVALDGDVVRANVERDAVTDVVRWLVENDIAIFEIFHERRTLEESFLSVTRHDADQ